MAVAKKSPRDLPKKADNNTAATPQSLPKPVSSVGVSSVLPGLQGGLSASEEQVRRRAYGQKLRYAFDDPEQERPQVIHYDGLSSDCRNSETAFFTYPSPL